MDEKIEAWKTAAKENAPTLRWPRHQFRSIASRDEDELCAIAYRIRIQVEELLESGVLRLGSKPKGDPYEVFDV